METKELAVELRNEIARAKQLTTNSDVHEIFISAENIISTLSFLISPIADMEMAYRKKIVEYMLEDSHAKAEAKAKASEEYKEWRKFTALYDLAHEQLMLLKKFREDLQKEYNVTG